MQRQRSDNHEVADGIAEYFATMVKDEVNIQNKERGTNVEVEFNIEHTNVEKKQAIRFVAMFIYGE